MSLLLSWCLPPDLAARGRAARGVRSVAYTSLAAAIPAALFTVAVALLGDSETATVLALSTVSASLALVFVRAGLPGRVAGVQLMVGLTLTAFWFVHHSGGVHSPNVCSVMLLPFIGMRVGG